MKNRLLPTSLSVVSIGSWLVLAVALLIPIWVTPWFEQLFYTSKILLAIVMGLLVTVSYLLLTWKNKVLRLAWSRLSLLVGIWLIIILASTFFSNSYPVENLLGFGSIYISGLLIALLGPTLFKESKNKNVGSTLLNLLTIGSLVIVVTSALQAVGFGPSLLLNKIGASNLPNNLVVNLAGSNLIAFQVLTITLVGWVTKVLKQLKEGESQPISLAAMFVLVAGILLNLWTMMPGKITQPIILPYTAAWSITIDSIRDVKTLLVGVGPEQFINAYNIYKPNWINTHKFGSIQFTQSSITPLSLLTTTGVFSALVWVVIFGILIKNFKSSRHNPVYWMLLASFVFELFLPLNVVIFLVQMVALAVFIAQEENTTMVQLQNWKFAPLKQKDKFINRQDQLFSQILTVILLLGVVATGYLAGRGFYALYLQNQAQIALQNNQAVQAYQAQQKAVQLNPYSDINHRKYAVINLSLASALSQKADLTESERAQFAQLIQQSIREAKAGTVVDPYDTRNWQTLGEVYQALNGVAEDADQWAVKSFVEAVVTSPADPNLRVRLGGIFYTQGDYANALRFFEQAVTLKADSANAYYNAANTLWKMNQLQEARLAYQKTMLLVDPSSSDYQKASQELNEVEQQLQTQAAQASEENNQPIEETNTQQNTQQPASDSASAETTPETTESPAAETNNEQPAQPTGEETTPAQP